MPSPGRRRITARRSVHTPPVATQFLYYHFYQLLCYYFYERPVCFITQILVDALPTHIRYPRIRSRAQNRVEFSDTLRRTQNIDRERFQPPALVSYLGLSPDGGITPVNPDLIVHSSNSG